MLAGAHFAKQAQVLLDWPVAIRRILAGFGQGAAGLAYQIGGLPIDVGVAGADQMFGEAEHLGEVVRGVIKIFFGAVRAGVSPVKAEPAHTVQNAIDKLLVLFHWIGVVEAHVATAAKVARQAEVQADAFGVADVQKAVGLRRKAGANARVRVDRRCQAALTSGGRRRCRAQDRRR